MRVSRSERQVSMQDDETRELIERRGWKLVDSYVDEGVSGTRERRPELDPLGEDARRHRFDLVVVWRADRLFRSLKHMVVTLDEWAALGVGFVSATEVFDTSSAQGRLLMHLVSAFAEFERTVIVERVRAGLAAARRRGARLGRPQARLDDERLLELRTGGMSVRQIARELGVGSSTIQRRLGRSDRLVARAEMAGG
jgi:DNA invertase Pin-like site-specific DNA recombinase